jgi:cytochrome P450
MVPEKYRLAAVGRFLLQQFELRRPGIRDWTPQIAASLRQQAETEISQMERQLHELEIDDPQYWQRVRRVVDDILLPRYLKSAAEENAQAARDYGIWRGGDLIARATFAAAGFILGIIAVEIPYIPIEAKWFPAVLLMAGPLVPDVATWWYRRRYRKKLDELVRDLGKASETLDTYRPLSELTQSLRSDLAEAPPVPPQRERS